LIRIAILKHWSETLQTELAETRRQSQETTAHLTAQLEATQKQMAEMMQIMQNLEQASGVPVQLSAIPPALHYTPVSMKV
jgi:phage gp37-like protein